MGCNSSKYSSGQQSQYNKGVESRSQDQKGVGTTIVACKTKDGIVFGVDSRSSTERYQGIGREHGRKREWKLEIKDDTDKVFEMSPNIAAVMAGEGYNCKMMCNSVKDACSIDSKSNKCKLSVSVVYEEMIQYLESPDGKDKQVGIIIAGWDEDKGFQVCRAFISDNQIEKDRNLYYASLGSGQQYANDIMADQYDYKMRIEDAVNLVLKALFYATLYDKSTGGYLQVYHMNKEGYVQKLRLMNSLQAYSICYDPCNETNTLFLVFTSTRQPFTNDDLITYFSRKYGVVAMAGHRVAHCVSKKQGVAAFWFHRLLFSENGASEVRSRIEAENANKARPCDFSVPKIYKKFDYRLELSTIADGREVKVPVYLRWSSNKGSNEGSKKLLEEMLSKFKIC